MATTAQYLSQLQKDKETLKTNLLDKGVEVSENDTFTELSSKVADIQAGGGSSYEITDGSYLFSSDARKKEINKILENNKNITTAQRMFDNTTFRDNQQDLSKFNTSKCTNMSYVFSRFSIGTNSNYDLSEDIKNWDTSNVTNMQGMFYYATIPSKLNFNNWDISSVTNIRNLFSQSTLSGGIEINEWKIRPRLDMNSAFSGLKSITTLDISKWNITNQSISSMFENSSSLENIYVNFENFSGGDFTSVFKGCQKLSNELIINFQKTSGYNSAFNGCNNIPKITLLNWNTAGNMAYMFRNCYRLTKLIIKNSTPFSLGSHANNMFENTPIAGFTSYTNGVEGYVYVDDDKVETYKSTTGWTNYADKIKPISELPAE